MRFTCGKHKRERCVSLCAHPLSSSFWSACHCTAGVQYCSVGGSDGKKGRQAIGWLGSNLPWSRETGMAQFLSWLALYVHIAQNWFINPTMSKNYQVEVMRKSKAEKLNVRQAWNGVGGREWLVVFSLSSIPALADGRGGGDITVSERHYEKCRVSIPPLPLSCLTCLGCSSGNNFPVLCCSKKRVGVFVIV